MRMQILWFNILTSYDHKISFMKTREISTIVLIKRSSSGQVWKSESNWIWMSDPFTEERVNSSVGVA